MLKKLIILFLVLAIFSCNTIKNSKKAVKEVREDSPVKNLILEPENELKVRQAVSDNVLINSDPYYADFALLILDIIKRKQWESFSQMTDTIFYNSYVVESSGSLVDYSMFMLHTADEGISTNHSLNEIENAFYTDSYTIDENIFFEGIYLYPTGETEFFKIMIEDSDIGLIITRE